MLTVGAGVLFIIGMGIRGHHWAWVASIAVLSLAVTALVHAAWFSVIWMFVKRSSAGRTSDRDTGKR